MGLTAIVSGTSSASASLLSSIGMEAGSIFVSVALIFLLGYLNLFDAIGKQDESQKQTILAATLPLVVAFSAIVLYQVLLVL